MLETLQISLLWLARRVWLSLPLLVTIAVMLITMAPANLFRGLAPAPDLVLVSVFFWAIYAPGFLPAWAVFLVGLTQDFATGGPIGFWALTYLIAYGFTLSQRVFLSGRSGPGVWIGFAIVAAATSVVVWVLGSITYARWLPAGHVLYQAVVSVIFYPLVAQLLLRLRRTLTTAREAI
ncbi:MAG: rod shape-determining protein MreD [Alphaproteobacteria bacterium]|nr:rod shape-determining protein MreD [Alphaproteobacteria bacterium]